MSKLIAVRIAQKHKSFLTRQSGMLGFKFNSRRMLTTATLDTVPNHIVCSKIATSLFLFYLT